MGDLLSHLKCCTAVPTYCIHTESKAHLDECIPGTGSKRINVQPAPTAMGRG